MEEATPAVKKRARNQVSKEELSKRLKGIDGEEDVQWWNHRLLFAAHHGRVSEAELHASMSYRVSCVKTTLRSIGCSSSIQSRIRLYSIVASKIQHRMGALLNMCVVYNKGDAAALSQIASISQTVQLLRDTMLKSDNMPEVVQRTLLRMPSIWDTGPREQELELMTSWDQAKTYMANRFVANVQVHVKTHLERRIKKRLSASLVSTSFDVAYNYVFAKGDPPDHQGDKSVCDVLAARLRGLKLITADGFCLPAREKVPVDIMLFHFELAFDAGSAFQPFPLANTVSRVHARVDERIYDKLTVGIPEAPSFQEFVKKRIQPARQRKKWTKHSFRRIRRSSTAKKKGFRKVKRKKRAKIQVVKKGQKIASFESDGYSVSLTVQTPHSSPAENLEAKQFHQQQLDKFRAVFDSESGCWVAGNDPGRRNIATQAVLLADEDPLAVPAKRVQFTRAQWNRVIQSKRQRAWEAKRRIGAVQIALDALSESGGKRGCDEEKWTNYITKSLEHQETLHREFLHNDERSKRRLYGYSLRRKAIDATASRLVTSPDGRPLIIGYGDGNFCSHGRGGTDTSVPTKSLFRAVQLAFKKKEVKGGVLKVWEHSTTAKCHRCQYRLDKVYKTVNGNLVEDLDFRRCSHCEHEQRPKLRNRDWNAALNIRVVVMSILRGEDRPEYLMPESRRAR